MTSNALQFTILILSLNIMEIVKLIYRNGLVRIEGDWEGWNPLQVKIPFNPLGEGICRKVELGDCELEGGPDVEDPNMSQGHLC
jgi:hypothetical protein